MNNATKIKKVIAINGSPKNKKASTTFHMLDPFLQGMAQAGAKTEIINLGEFNIQRCLGCVSCFIKTPGKCVINDDVAIIKEKCATADLIVFGTPLYNFSMTGLLKDFCDRGLASVEPWFVADDERNGDTYHPSRNQKKSKKIFLVSPCAFPEFNNFDALVHTFKVIAQKSNNKYLGEILRPGSLALKFEATQKQAESYYELLKPAGKQLIEDEKIDEAIMAKLRENIFPGDADAYREFVNKCFENLLKKQ